MTHRLPDIRRGVSEGLDEAGQQGRPHDSFCLPCSHALHCLAHCAEQRLRTSLLTTVPPVKAPHPRCGLLSLTLSTADLHAQDGGTVWVRRACTCMPAGSLSDDSRSDAQCCRSGSRQQPRTGRFARQASIACCARSCTCTGIPKQKSHFHVPGWLHEHNRARRARTAQTAQVAAVLVACKGTEHCEMLWCIGARVEEGLPRETGHRRSPAAGAPGQQSGGPERGQPRWQKLARPPALVFWLPRHPLPLSPSLPAPPVKARQQAIDGCHHESLLQSADGDVTRTAREAVLERSEVLTVGMCGFHRGCGTAAVTR